MISVTKLLGGAEHFGDQLRYNESSRGAVHGATHGSGPVVVWNVTRTCNLKCIHCYMESDATRYENELTTAEGKRFIDDLAEFRVPVILFSGGEPLLRADFFELARYAVARGLRVTISTNGTLLDRETARDIKKIGVGYVGISIDSIGEKNDEFRKVRGAFDKALAGIRNCLEIGQRVGLRFTINRHNYAEMENIFRLIEEEGIPRVCFYHLVYAGRGSEMMKEDVTLEESRSAMDLIIDKTLYFQEKGLDKEILTVDNHADGVYVYLRMLKENPRRAEKVWELLRNNGGNRSGIAIGQVDNQGFVHADQFTQNHPFGDVRERKFGDVWTATSHPILDGLRNRKPLLKGRCASCKWLAVCNGNFRARAEAATGDFWAADPACYLTDAEI
ncbi:MAG: putative heme d1 biosynthesis radical SAM protein NirJ1 [Dethiobacter sp.]|nr:putative heme d1 biosynthesis radical SAM protein NirJ1 [Dethiobacter sp.]MCL5981184.1 putative heme d1 biosynthesis radical SAM protein NirJ1 [Bacillota bacterium]